MRLRAATPDDLAQVLGWLPDAHALKLWGGAALSYPPSPATTWQEIHGERCPGHALIDDAGHLLGYGQVLEVNEARPAHLARIIVNPACRGVGLGRVLIERLIATTLAERTPSHFSLTVYLENHVARRLYARLGFVDGAIDAKQGFASMEKRVEAAVAR